MRSHPNIEVLEHHHGVDLITTGKHLRIGGPNRCLGAYVLDVDGRRVLTVRAQCTVLATGGAGKVYKYTTNPDVATKINSSYQFELTGDNGGSWAVDLTKKEDFVTGGTIENPKVTITMAAKDFVDLVEGRLNGQMAFMQGKLKLKGDMSLALKLQQLIG